MNKYFNNVASWWNDRDPDEKRLALLSGSITAVTVLGLYIWHEKRKDVGIPCDETLPYAMIEAIISKPRLRKSLNSVNSQLQTLLDQYCTEKSGLYIEYNGFLSSHSAHAIVALYRLGCTKDTIVSYMKDFYIHRLQTQTEYKKDFQLRYGVKPSPLFQNVDISINKYVYFFKGRRENFYGLYHKFKQELQNNPLYENNAKRLVSKFFPLFSSGMSGAAFHGLIQLGYGISSDHTETILEGLAYLIHSYLQFDTQLQRVDDAFDDEEFTTHADNNSKSKLSIVSSIFDILDKMKKEQHFPESAVSRLKQYSNSDEINSIIGAGSYIRSMTILSNYAQAEITQRFLPLLPLLTNLFAKSSNNNNNNNNKDETENKTETLNTKNTQGGHNSESGQMQQISAFVLSNVLAVWTYAVNDQYNDFFLLHGVTGAWSLLEIIDKTKLYSTNKHACLACIRQFFYALGAVYAMEGCPDINCPQWLIDETKEKLDNLSRGSYNNPNKYENGIYLSRMSNRNRMQNNNELRDLLKRQIATMANELRPIQSNGSSFSPPTGSHSNADNSFLHGNNNSLRSKVFNNPNKRLENVEPVWRDEHIYKGLQIVLESVDDGLIDLRLARDAIAKLRYKFRFNAVITPTYRKIVSSIQNAFSSPIA